MDCHELRERYTDFRDGLISASRERPRVERHLAHCASCREWESALRRGVLALRAAAIEASPDFRRRLEARLAAERGRVAEPEVGARAGLAAALFVAAALTMIAVQGVRPHAPAAALPPVPFPKPVARAGIPFVTFQDPRAGVAGNQNPYGTALVQPASHVEPATAGR
jgi:putative zinc finger protein